jgi:cytochrome c553
MKIEEIKAAISQLSPDDLSQLAAWFIAFQARVPDQPVDPDVKGGKLDQLAQQVKEDSPPKRD